MTGRLGGHQTKQRRYQSAAPSTASPSWPSREPAARLRPPVPVVMPCRDERCVRVTDQQQCLIAGALNWPWKGDGGVGSGRTSRERELAMRLDWSGCRRWRRRSSGLLLSGTSSGLQGGRGAPWARTGLARGAWPAGSHRLVDLPWPERGEAANLQRPGGDGCSGPPPGRWGPYLGGLGAVAGHGGCWRGTHGLGACLPSAQRPRANGCSAPRGWPVPALAPGEPHPTSRGAFYGGAAGGSLALATGVAPLAAGGRRR